MLNCASVMEEVLFFLFWNGPESSSENPSLIPFPVLYLGLPEVALVWVFWAGWIDLEGETGRVVKMFFCFYIAYPGSLK